MPLAISTVNRERFTGLNFCGFHPLKFFMGKLSWCLTFKTLKQHYHMKLVQNKYSQKNFVVLLKTTRNFGKSFPVYSSFRGTCTHTHTSVERY